MSARRYNGERKRARLHAMLREEIRLRAMVEQARASHREAMKASNDYEREVLKSDALWWLANARQEKDALS